MLSAAQLLDLRMAEQIIDRAILAELAAGTEYHDAFQAVKETVLQVAALAFAPVGAAAMANNYAVQSAPAGGQRERTGA